MLKTINDRNYIVRQKINCGFVPRTKHRHTATDLQIEKLHIPLTLVDKPQVIVPELLRPYHEPVQEVKVPVSLLNELTEDALPEVKVPFAFDDTDDEDEDEDEEEAIQEDKETKETKETKKVLLELRDIDLDRGGYCAWLYISTRSEKVFINEICACSLATEIVNVT
jgi:hypothetical protein